MSREVRRMRRERDWTQAQLAERIGISRQSLVEIEKGGNPSLSTALALGRALSVPVAELFPDLDREADGIIERINGSRP